MMNKLKISQSREIFGSMIKPTKFMKDKTIGFEMPLKKSLNFIGCHKEKKIAVGNRKNIFESIIS